MLDKKNLDFEKLGGLVPAVIVDDNSGSVLMLGFMNEEALEKTLESKKVTFFSRTKKRLWVKGETSGNFLNLVDIKSDCDNDSLLVYVNPVGPTCHTGDYSCFGVEKNDSDISFLMYLFELIAKRKKEMPEGSYTTRLFKEGENRIIQKVGEEAVETVIAAKNNDREEMINEISDLVYHLFVLMNEKSIGLNDIVNCLSERHKPKK